MPGRPSYTPRTEGAAAAHKEEQPTPTHAHDGRHGTKSAESSNTITINAAMLQRLAKREPVKVGDVTLVAAEDFPPYWRVR